MNKLETIAYYEALQAANRIIIVDSTDDDQTIREKIREKANLENIGTIHIEVFHNDENVSSYSLIQVSGLYDLWIKKIRKVEQKSIDDVADYVISNLPEPIKSPYDKYVAKQLDSTTYLIKSFSDDTFELKLNPNRATLSQMQDHVLGQYVMSDGQLECHPINTADISSLLELTKSIKDEKIRLFAQTCLRAIPDYVFEIPAGISGRKNSASDLAQGGLLRHIKNATKFIITLANVDYTKIKFTQHELDMMIVAVLFSDAFKHGWQEDYNSNHTPRADHPKIAADFIRAMNGILSPSELNFIANSIESHMGQWYDAKRVSLPVPDTEYKYMVHLAHYLTSLKNVTFTEDNDDLYVFNSQNIISLESFTVIDDKDLEALQNLLNSTIPIDMSIAENLDIIHSEEEIRDVWHTLLDAKQASDKQIKYIALARELVHET